MFIGKSFLSYMDTEMAGEPLHAMDAAEKLNKTPGTVTS
jgi:hypothetical protein